MKIKTEYDIIKRPIITEKLTFIQEENPNIVGFIVDKKATKPEIKKAVEKIFNVKVKKVRVINMKGKPKRFGRFEGRRSSFKKAYVILEKGQKINFIE